MKKYLTGVVYLISLVSQRANVKWKEYRLCIKRLFRKLLAQQSKREYMDVVSYPRSHQD